ncbi:hypothetical protein [Paraburkholderia sp. SIMBA_054]|uniref:hypothetical protein n=1 Tax=Paraburkholderia sp. SIMBA_054 TaxID=3085795 RepID=UPI00397B4A0D
MAAFDRSDDAGAYVQRDQRLQVVTRAQVAERFPQLFSGTITVDAGCLDVAADNDSEPVLLIGSSQDRNTILAALRFYQSAGMGDPVNQSDEIHDLATNGNEDISMDSDGIDDLCERVNTSSLRTFAGMESTPAPEQEAAVSRSAM